MANNQAVLNTDLRPGERLVVVAAGRLGHFAGNKPVISSDFDQLILYAVQYGRAFGAQVLGIDGGSEKGRLCEVYRCSGVY